MTYLVGAVWAIGVAVIFSLGHIAIRHAVVALPLAQTTSRFTLIFSVIFIGLKLEKVTHKLTEGALFVVAGSP